MIVNHEWFVHTGLVSWHFFCRKRHCTTIRGGFVPLYSEYSHGDNLLTGVIVSATYLPLENVYAEKRNMIPWRAFFVYTNLICEFCKSIPDVFAYSHVSTEQMIQPKLTRTFRFKSREHLLNLLVCEQLQTVNLIIRCLCFVWIDLWWNNSCNFGTIICSQLSTILGECSNCNRYFYNTITNL